MKFTKPILLAIAALVVPYVLLDALGGYFLDGPIGPIPGGQMSGRINNTPHPDWESMDLSKVIELEIRPHRPWSLSVWNAVVDGELYIPSAHGARRRWPQVVIEDPRVRVRIGDQIFERRANKVSTREERLRVAQAFDDRYNLGDPERDFTTWFFHLDKP